MCTVNDDDGEFLMMPKQPLPLSKKVCRSCDNEAKVVLRKKDAYCKSCFLNSSTHKFRAILGKSKMLKPGDKVLVIFTGSFSSIALLHFLYSGLNEVHSKRLVFASDLLFIDDGLAMGAKFDNRQEAVKEAKKIASSFNFQIYITTLSEVLSQTPNANAQLIVRQEYEQQMEEIFKTIKSSTAKQDLLHQLRHKLVLKIANNMGYDKVFTPEVGTDLAIKLLVGITLGRGDQMSAEVGFCDNTVRSTPVLRPLKDFTQKEIIFYNFFHEIEPMNMFSVINTSLNDANIQKTTENFVNDLQEKFPSTVYTIFRTGDKLEMGENAVDKKHEHCMLCGKLVKNSSVEICDVIDALDFSRKVSEGNVKTCNGCPCTKEIETFNEKTIQNFFCYGCTLIVKDMERKDIFCRSLLKEEIFARNLQNLKNQVAEFLID